VVGPKTIIADRKKLSAIKSQKWIWRLKRVEGGERLRNCESVVSRRFEAFGSGLWVFSCWGFWKLIAVFWSSWKRFVGFWIYLGFSFRGSWELIAVFSFWGFWKRFVSFLFCSFWELNMCFWIYLGFYFIKGPGSGFGFFFFKGLGADHCFWSSWKRFMFFFWNSWELIIIFL
jgi:hypothetical protein